MSTEIIPEASTFKGGKYGPCWAARCGGEVYWPGNTVTARVRCNDPVWGPREGVQRPAVAS